MQLFIKSVKTILYVIILYIPINISVFPSPTDDELELPVLNIEMSEHHLNLLNQNPKWDTYYPCIVKFKNHSYICEARYRGSSARTLPKKSWRIKFPNTVNPFEDTHINLNAEYRDKSLIRNYLAMKLFANGGYPASEIGFLNIKVNGEFAGVYVWVEDVSDVFFDKRGIDAEWVFKAKSNGALMAPILHDDDFRLTWELKEGDVQDYKTLQSFFNIIYSFSDADFFYTIPNRVNVDNVLNYFAITFSITSTDCYTKNLFIYLNEKTGKIELLPWDNDAAFGNDWRGNYHSDYSKTLLGQNLDFQLLFQRMMENEAWYTLYWDKVSEITSKQFDTTSLLIDSTYEKIKNDVLLDTAKIGSNAQFTNEKNRLHDFFTSRTAFLETNKFPSRVDLDSLTITPMVSESGKFQAHVRVILSSENQIRFRSIDKLDFNRNGAAYQADSHPLTSENTDARPYAYSATVDLSFRDNKFIPFALQIGAYYYPATGLYYINYIPVRTPAISYLDFKEEIDLEIVDIRKLADEYVVKIKNTGNDELHLGYCALESSKSNEAFLFPANFKLPAGKTTVIASTAEIGQILFPNDNLLTGLYFPLFEQDSIFIKTSLNKTISATEIQFSENSNQPNLLVIISEFKNQPFEDEDPGDWIELYNPNETAIDLQNWFVKDAKNDHLFVISQSRKISAQSYIVLCEDINAFNDFYGGPIDAIGSFDFGLSKESDEIRIFNPANQLVDSIKYDEINWHFDEDSENRTWEIIHLDQNNADPENWYISGVQGGTPGMQNSKPPEPKPELVNFVSDNYPNPFNSSTGFTISVKQPTKVSINVFNILGQRVTSIIDKPLNQGIHKIRWAPRNISTGAYFYIIQFDHQIMKKSKMMYLK